MATKTPAKRNTDWDACHRDYRTGKFTQRELADKYGVTHGAVGKKIRELKWEKDLTEEIRTATNARLASALVAKEVAKGSQEVANTILAAAETNAQLIWKHQKNLSELHEVVEAAKSAVMKAGATVEDIREAAVFVQAASGLASATKTLQDQERKAFGLDLAGENKDNDLSDQFMAIVEAKEAMERGSS